MEARGFLIAGAASAVCGAGVLTVRKAGKLPRAVLREEYSLEYGTAALEVHEGELPPGSRVLIVDDVLATGGTVAAAATATMEASRPLEPPPCHRNASSARSPSPRR